jgi:hypothetical protein
VVGAHWFQYCDEPFGGREDGEDYNMGLIDNMNRPYEELTSVFLDLNPKMESVHADGVQQRRLLLATTPPGGGSFSETYEISQADRPIRVDDQSLMDWDKEKTRILGFQTRKPHVPFGDVHLAWKPEGLYLASLANTYVDPDFLHYNGEFPLSESFQIHLLIEVKGAIEHFGIHLVPQKDPRFPDGFEVVPKLYRYSGGKPVESLPVQGRVQRLNKSLPHTAVEAFFPAAWLGKDHLEPGSRLRMNIILSSYYREMMMTWSGEPSLRNLENPGSLRTVLLKPVHESHADLAPPQPAESSFAQRRDVP